VTSYGSKLPNVFWCKFHATAEAKNTCLLAEELVFVNDKIVSFFNFPGGISIVPGKIPRINIGGK